MSTFDRNSVPLIPFFYSYEVTHALYCRLLYQNVFRPFEAFYNDYTGQLWQSTPQPGKVDCPDNVTVQGKYDNALPNLNRQIVLAMSLYRENMTIHSSPEQVNCPLIITIQENKRIPLIDSKLYICTEAIRAIHSLTTTGRLFIHFHYTSQLCTFNQSSTWIVVNIVL